ncbi:MAG: hemerythrin domain-containing protein [Deltaproteobacteria bacterium]|nr:hemerythrin domain-containing protein [Deltaproteobacteria bacterium]
MNALRVLMAQHDRVEGLLVDLQQSGERGDDARLAALRAFARALRRHLEAEERFFYPAIAPKLILVEAASFLEEHAEVRAKLERLEGVGPQGSEEFTRAWEALHGALVRHVGDEEIELFPEVKRRFAVDDLDALGEQISQAFEPEPEPELERGGELPEQQLAEDAEHQHGEP